MPPTPDEIAALGITPLDNPDALHHGSLLFDIVPDNRIAYSHSTIWINRVGTYLYAAFDEVMGDSIVQVFLTGSASRSAFYYGIVEVTGNAEPYFDSQQVMDNRGDSWRTISAQGLFRVRSNGRAVFSAKLRAGDLPGDVTVFHLGIVARVVGAIRR